MTDFCSVCQAVEEGPYCPEQGVVRRPFAIGGRYEVDELVRAHTGSFVFGARDRAAPRSVAVKVLRSQLTSAQFAEVYEAQQDFLRELAAPAADRVGIVDFGWDDALGVSYLVACRSGDPMQRPSVDEIEGQLAELEAAARVREGGGAAGDSREVPTMIGSYQVIGSLGSGGTGRVYLGEHPVIGSKVAIKVLLPEIARSTETVERFIQEARASSQIGSPHIPRYFDFGTTQAGLPYAIMEYFEGETLGGRLGRTGTVPLAETANIVEQIASALLMAHDAGLIHRDLKPDNILLVKPDRPTRATPINAATGSGARAMPGVEVKVLDFGIAKVIGNRSATRTLTGAFLGTPFYCAPEQVFGHDVDARTDVYSLGVTAYEMLTGAPPFVGVVPVILSSKATEEAPDLADAGVPPIVANTIRRMLAREPRHRAPSMAWVLEQIALWRQSGVLHALGSVEIATPPRAHEADHDAVTQVAGGAPIARVEPRATQVDVPVALPQVTRARFPPHRRRRRMLPVAVGALVAGAAIVVIGMRLRAPSPAAPLRPSAPPVQAARPTADESHRSPAGRTNGSDAVEQTGMAAPAIVPAPPVAPAPAPVEPPAAHAVDAASAGSAASTPPAERAVIRRPGRPPDKRPGKRTPATKPSREPKDILIVDPFSPGSLPPSPRSDSP